MLGAVCSPASTDELIPSCDWCGRPSVGWRLIAPGSVRDVVRGGKVIDRKIQLEVRAYYCEQHAEVRPGPPPDKVLKRRRRVGEEQLEMFPSERRGGSAITDA